MQVIGRMCGYWKYIVRNEYTGKKSIKKKKKGKLKEKINKKNIL
jgi:hypothetical protein